jgi:hypothetical protein
MNNLKRLEEEVSGIAGWMLKPTPMAAAFRGTWDFTAGGKR